ncbi:MAG: hypothetical protein GY842_21340 [bacterium]|nr:hypothetical protein [bacterium]
MSLRKRTLECPQCGGRIGGRGQYCCHTCGYVLDMARVSYEGALRHDRHESWRRRLELIHALLWAVVSAALLGVVALRPGPVIFIGGVVGVVVQVCWGRMILARLRKR